MNVVSIFATVGFFFLCVCEHVPFPQLTVVSGVEQIYSKGAAECSSLQQQVCDQSWVFTKQETFPLNSFFGTFFFLAVMTVPSVRDFP